MKCPQCLGSGVMAYPVDYEQGLFDEMNCSMCNGEGTVQTNEEWIKSCNTEQLAEWIGNVLDEVCDTSNYNCKNCFKWCNRKKVVEWLKQPHQ